MLGRLCTSSHGKVARFRRGWIRQSDEDFLRELKLPDDETAREVALAVRRAVANVGLIDPLFIQADDRADVELSVLPLWDSMDWVAFWLELEEELNLAIPDKEASKVHIANFSVRNFITELLPVVRRLRTIAPGR